MSASAGVSLAWLLDGIARLPGTARLSGTADSSARVVDLTLDSREVRIGSLFVALPGQRSHGLDFAAQAAAQGASVVLWDPADARGREMPATARTDSCFFAPVSGLRQVLGRIADRFFGRPSAHLRIVGITGTNGKTTCAYLLAQCLEHLQRDAAYVGTLGWGRIGALQESAHTTADVVSVHRQLAQLRASGVQDVALEVSSHALDQGRVDAVRFKAAAFTNLTRDHLDYHLSMQAYGAAKARLFAMEGLEHGIINIGDAAGLDMARACRGRVPLTAVWVGAWESGRLQGRPQGPLPDGLADRALFADDIVPDPCGISMHIAGSFGERQVSTQLLGRFNAENSLIVLGCLTALDVSLEAAAVALARCKAPPGRMEVIDARHRDKPRAVIDYAHTPDALAKALGAAREHCRGVLWCVFGCGGDRDAGKRPLMGAIADELADQIIITDDNPRSEDPQSITRAIEGGISAHRVRVIHDRGAAIAAALTEALADDMVLIAGKGHEDYQIYGETRRSFNDRAQAQSCLGVAA